MKLSCALASFGRNRLAALPSRCSGISAPLLRDSLRVGTGSVIQLFEFCCESTNGVERIVPGSSPKESANLGTGRKGIANPNEQPGVRTVGSRLCSVPCERLVVCAVFVGGSAAVGDALGFEDFNLRFLVRDVGD